MERHAYEACDHEGRHGYTLLSDTSEYEMCERCRRGPEAHVSTLEADEDAAFSAGHSIVLGGNLTGHVVHTLDCEGCE